MHPTDIDNRGWTIKTNDTLSDAEQREDARIASAVKAKVNQMRAQGVSVACYNSERGEAYFETPENSHLVEECLR